MDVLVLSCNRTNITGLGFEFQYKGLHLAFFELQGAFYPALVASFMNTPGLVLSCGGTSYYTRLKLNICYMALAATLLHKL